MCRFLERMAAEAADTGALADGTYRGVPLRIVADAADGEGSQDAFSTDTDHGFLSVPVSAPAQDVYKYIQVWPPVLIFLDCQLLSTAASLRGCEGYTWK